MIPITNQDPEGFPNSIILALATTLDSLLQEPEDLEIVQTRNVD